MNLTGAKPTAQQVAQLEAAHKNLFAALVQAAEFRIALARKFGLKSKQFLDFNKLYVPQVKKFLDRQIKLEVGAKIPPIIPVKTVADLINSFFASTGVEVLKKKLREYDREGKGIGFIPLIIWAVIAVAGMFTADSIADEINTTAEEQKELVDSTKDFCQANNLTPEQCRAIWQEQQQTIQDSGGGFPWLLLLGLGVAAAIIVPKILPKKQAA